MDETTTIADTGSSAAPDTSTSATPPPTASTAQEAVAQVLAKHTTAEGEGATTGPAVEGGDPLATKKGPIPFDVHSTALTNARAKEREAALAEWRQQYGWAEQIDQSTLNSALEFYRGFNDPAGDPIALVQQLIDRVSTHPEHGARLRSLAAKQLAAARGQAQPSDEQPQPDVAITDADGRVVGHTYSSEGLAKRDAWLERQMLAKLRTELEPVTQTVQEVAKERAHLQAEAQAKAWGDTFGKDIDTMPLMDPTAHKENRQAVGRLVKQWCDALPVEQANNPQVLEVLTTRAWRQLVLPKLQQTEHAQTVASLKQKAVAQVESATGTAPASIPRPKNTQELAKFMRQRASAR